MQEFSQGEEKEAIIKISFNHFKELILNDSSKIRFPVMVTGIPHKYIFSQINHLTKMLKADFRTDPIIGRVKIVKNQIRIIIHDGHHTSVCQYQEGKRRIFDIKVEAFTDLNGNMSLHQLAVRQGQDMASL